MDDLEYFNRRGLLIPLHPFIDFSSSNIIFEGGDNKNDPGQLAKALQKMEIGRPGSFGGAFLDAKNEDIVYQKFKTHTPPDITKNTRIIAVLGIDQKNANRKQDGWFLSDFFAFWHLYNNLTSHQVWMHGLQLEPLVDRYKVYLHGSPYKERKVVLDADILSRAESGRHAPEYTKPAVLKERFKKVLREQCEKATEFGDNVLVLVFAHGHRVHKPKFGPDDDRNAWDYEFVLGSGNRSAFEMKHFKSTTKSSAANITLLTTACFSGGWVCHKRDDVRLNITALTAAGWNTPSLSWRSSLSLGRHCGSMFASTIVEKLCRVGQKSILDEEGDDDTPLTTEQEESYAEFVRTTHELLLTDIDQRGYEHSFTFGAKDDDWSMNWRERTGAPLELYRNRWDALKSWPKDPKLHPGDFQNRDPNVPQALRDEYLKEWTINEAKKAGKSMPRDASGASNASRRSSALYGGTVGSLQSMVIALAKEYLPAYSYGYNTNETAIDGPLHTLLNRLVNGRPTDLDEEDLDRALNGLNFRLGQMDAATTYLDMMEVARPNDESCREFNTSNLHKVMGAQKYQSLRLLALSFPVLFPDPITAHTLGREFFKGSEYIAAAFHFAGIDREEARRRLGKLASEVEVVVDDQKDLVQQNPDIMKKRRKLFHAFV